MNLTLNDDKIKNLSEVFIKKYLKKCYHIKIIIQIILFYFLSSRVQKKTIVNYTKVFFNKKMKKLIYLEGKKVTCGPYRQQILIVC